MVESEPTISTSETTLGGNVATMEHTAPESLDDSQKVTDEQLQGLDPSVLELMSSANAVLGGEQTVDEAFKDDTSNEAEAKDNDVAVATNASTSAPAAYTLASAAQPTPPAAPVSPVPASNAPSDGSSRQDSDEVPVYTFTTVDDSHGREVRAHELAEKRLTTELNEGGKFKRFLKSIWQGNIARDQYIAKYAAQYRQSIDQAGSINLDDDNSGFEKQALIDRFSSEYDETVHAEAGERRAELASDSEFATRTKDLLRQYANGELDDESLIEERGRLLKELADAGNDELLGEGKLRIDNLVQIAQAVKGSFEHGKSLDRMLDAMRFINGEAKSGARTEVHYNRVEKVAQRLSSGRLGALMSPEAVITAVGVTTTLLHLGSRSATNAALKTIAPGLSGAIWAGACEGRRTKEERAQNARERAYGGKIGESDKRRLEMDQTNYDLATAASLTEELRSLTGEEVDLSKREALEAALTSLAAIEARMKLADGHHVDLITYDDQTTVEAGRFDLDLARAEAKAAINQHLTDELRTQLGFPAEQSVNELIGQRSQATVEALSEMMSERDKAFNKLRTKRMASAALKGLIIGGTIGLAAQETMAAFDPSRAGLIEQLWHAKTGLINGEQHQTFLEGLANGDHSAIHHMAESTFGPDQHIGQNGTLSMSADHSINYDPTNHTLSFTDPTGHETIGHVPVESDGSLSQSTQHMLEAKGFHVEDFSHQVTDAPEVSTSTQTIGVEDYVHQHPELTTHIKRDMWFDNNTPGKFDRNELGLHWGGSGVNQDGSFQMSVSSMTENGSFHDGTSVDWSQAAAAGHLELAVSATSGTQTEVFMVPIGPDGSIHIAADNPAAHFFANENGHAVFNGKYAEVVQTLKTDDAGVEHVRPLATLVGHNNVSSVQETIQTVIPHSHTEFDYRITSPGYETVQSNFTEMAPNIPVIPRRAMEVIRPGASKIETELNIYRAIYGGGDSLEAMREWVEERPGRLHSRRYLEDEGRWVEADGSTVERNVDRERAEIAKYLEREAQRDPAYIERVRQVANQLGAMGDSTRVAVCVPAWMEERAIGNFLDQYMQQTRRTVDGGEIDKDLYEINVLVNHRKGAEEDGTARVIQEFIDNYTAEHGGTRPNINFVDVEFNAPEANVGFARKLLTDAVMMRSVARGAQSAPLYIESEDADITRLDHHTIFNLIEKLDTNPWLDAVRGTDDRSPDILMQNDKLFLERRLWNFTSALIGQKVFRQPENSNWNSMWNRVYTNGWNSGFTAEAYALIDGYTPIPVGEDMQIGARISMVRGDGSIPNLEVVARIGTRSDSSPRRFIAAIEAGVEAYDEGQFTNPRVNKLIRENSDEELLKQIDRVRRIDVDNEAEFNGMIQNYYNTMNYEHWAPSFDESERVMRRVMFWIGFSRDDYEISNVKDANGRTVSSSINVKSWDHVKKALNDYRLRHGVTDLSPGDVEVNPASNQTPALSADDTPTQEIPVSEIIAASQLDSAPEAPADVNSEASEGTLIGEGLQYRVFDEGNGRVMKDPGGLNTSTVAENMRRMYLIPNDLPKEEAEARANSIILARDRGARFVRRLAQNRPDQLWLFGNPSIDQNGRIEQDKVTLFSDYLDSQATEDEKRRAIDKYVDAVKNALRAGAIEYTFNFGRNFGVDNSGQVVLIDFGELGLRKNDAHGVIDVRGWEQSHDATLLSPELRAYFNEAMAREITHETVDELWPARG